MVPHVSTALLTLTELIAGRVNQMVIIHVYAASHNFERLIRLMNLIIHNNNN